MVAARLSCLLAAASVKDGFAMLAKVSDEVEVPMPQMMPETFYNNANAAPASDAALLSEVQEVRAVKTMSEAVKSLAEEFNFDAEKADGAAGMGAYHSSKQIISMFTKMEKNCMVPMKTAWIQDADSEGKLFVAHLGNEQAEKTVMVAANEHAREMITAEVALRLAQQLCGRQSKTKSSGGDSVLEQGAETGQRTDKAFITAMLQKVRYTIIPVVNVKGRQLVETKENVCQRSTSSDEGDVDLNRNMDVDWGKGPAQSWGEKPFSMYQARIMRDIAHNRKPTSYIDLHTGARDLMTSFGFKRAVSADYPDQTKMLNLVKQRHCPDCAMGPNSVVIGYPNPGEIIDHMYVKQGIKYTSLWELYKGEDTSDCLGYFNPPDHQYEEQVDNWSNALLTVGEYVDGSVNKEERSNPKVTDWNPTGAQGSLISQFDFEDVGAGGSFFNAPMTT